MVHSNLMVDLRPSNEKLVQRAVRIVSSATGAEEPEARRALEEADMHCKTAIVMILMNLSAEEARLALTKADGRIAQAVEKG